MNIEFIFLFICFGLAFSKDEELQLKNLLKLLSNNVDKTVKQITVKDWIKKDLQLNKNNLSASSLRSITTAFKYFTDFIGSETFINDISKERLVEFRSFLFNKIKNLVYWRTLKSSLNRALSYGYLQVNHFNSVKPPKQQQRKPKNISWNELELILEHLPAGLKDLVQLTYLTGLRLAEAVFLTWNDVNLQQRILIIGSENFQTKTRNSRTIPLSVESFQILQNRLPKILNVNEKNFVFTKGNDRKYSKDYISKTFKAAVRKAGLNELYTFHSLRHSFASNLVSRNVSIYQVQKLLGHRNLSTTEIYANISFDSLREAINKLNNNYKTNEGIK